MRVSGVMLSDVDRAKCTGCGVTSVHHGGAVYVVKHFQQESFFNNKTVLDRST